MPTTEKHHTPRLTRTTPNLLETKKKKATMTIVSPERVFQDNLRSFRLSYGLKQHHMATLLQIKQKTYGSYEEGRAFPRPLVLLKLAFHFECEVEELLTECLESQAA